MSDGIATSNLDAPRSRRVLVLGATSTIGCATMNALLERGHEEVCPVRPLDVPRRTLGRAESARLLGDAIIRFGGVTDPASFAGDGVCGEHFDAIVSCLASRIGYIPLSALCLKR